MVVNWPEDGNFTCGHALISTTTTNKKWKQICRIIVRCSQSLLPPFPVIVVNWYVLNADAEVFAYSKLGYHAHFVVWKNLPDATELSYGGSLKIREYLESFHKSHNLVLHQIFTRVVERYITCILERLNYCYNMQACKCWKRFWCVEVDSGKVYALRFDIRFYISQFILWFFSRSSCVLILPVITILSCVQEDS